MFIDITLYPAHINTENVPGMPNFTPADSAGTPNLSLSRVLPKLRKFPSYSSNYEASPEIDARDCVVSAKARGERFNVLTWRTNIDLFCNLTLEVTLAVTYNYSCL